MKMKKLTEQINQLLGEGKSSYTYTFDVDKDNDRAAKKQLKYFLTDPDYAELTKDEFKKVKIGSFSYEEGDEEDEEYYMATVKLTADDDIIKKIKAGLE